MKTSSDMSYSYILKAQAEVMATLATFAIQLHRHYSLAPPLPNSFSLLGTKLFLHKLQRVLSPETENAASGVRQIL